MGAIKEKLKLYHILLSIPSKMLSESEINIMYELSKDHEIQNELEKRLEKKKDKNNGTTR